MSTCPRCGTDPHSWTRLGDGDHLVMVEAPMEVHAAETVGNEYRVTVSQQVGFAWCSDLDWTGTGHDATQGPAGVQRPPS